MKEWKDAAWAAAILMGFYALTALVIIPIGLIAGAVAMLGGLLLPVWSLLSSKRS